MMQDGAVTSIIILVYPCHSFPAYAQ